MLYDVTHVVKQYLDKNELINMVRAYELANTAIPKTHEHTITLPTL